METVGTLKKLISETLPDQFSAETLEKDYTMLNHMDGQCEYDPTTNEESQFVDENFGFAADLHSDEFDDEVDQSEEGEGDES